MQILQKNHQLWKYLSCHSTWGKYIYSTQSTHFFVSSILGILKILRVVPSSSSSSLLSSFDDSAKLLHYRDGPGYCSSWGISSLTTILDGILFPQPLFLLTFSALFCCNKVLNVSSIGISALSWEIVLGNSAKFLHDPMDNS